MAAISKAKKEYKMSFKRKIFNIFAAVVMVFGSVPISFTNTFAADDEPTGIVPEE